VSIRPEHRKTFSKGRIPETLLMFIRLRGGPHAAMDAAFAYAPLADYFELSEAARGLSRSAYYTNDPKPGNAWDSEVQWAANELKKDGYAVRTIRSGRPIWQLTPSGVTRADFWLSRMKEKAAALKALTVGAQLASLEDDWSRALDLA
jgi:hypothetical protein